MTSDPVARALAQVEREARKAATKATGCDYVGTDGSVWYAAERDVWKAAAERYLRALYEAQQIVDDFLHGPRPHSDTQAERISRLEDLLADCFPPEREEPNYER